MDKPRFIRGLLEEVGTAIDPITLVRRIPEGLEIPGLREGLSRMIKEYEIQHSISSGVALVMRGEVAVAQTTLRAGQRKGVKFDILQKDSDHVDVAAQDVQTDIRPLKPTPGLPIPRMQKHKPGHCFGCHEAFSEDDFETLVGFACGHVFHLKHLLDLARGEQMRPLVSSEDGQENAEDEDFGNGRSVGAKVTHARLMKDKIADGCPACARITA